MNRRSASVALAAALAVSMVGCSGGTSGGDASGQPSVQVTANTRAPVAIPPLGDDISCMDTVHCMLRNPDQLTDQQWIERLPSLPGGNQAPTEDMRPWAYVVLGLGEGKTDAHAQPSADSPVVGDEYRIVNHRALFAFCRTAGDPHQAWYLVEAITAPAPAQTWMSGEHLYPYGHDGAIPTC